MLSPRLFVAQRITAILMAPLALGHLAGIIYTIQGELDAADILARTHGNAWFAVFYGLFVAAAAIHAAIGVRVVCYEWGHLRGWLLDGASWLLGLALLSMGAFAVFAVTVP